MPDGGGGGDGDSRQAAKEDEARKAKARNDLNTLFGIAPPTDLSAEKVPNQFGVPSPALPYEPPPAARPGGPLPWNPTGTTWWPLQPPVTHAPPAAPPVDPRIAAAATNKAARDADYQKIFDDVLGLNKENIDRERDVAARKNKFQIFRQGLQTGSADIDQQRLLKEATDRNYLHASDLASGARTNAKSTDESARLDLLRQISGGLDAGSAATSAVRGMDIARENAYDNAKEHLIEGGFDSAGLLYQGQQNANAMARGRALYEKLAGARTPGGNSYFGS